MITELSEQIQSAANLKRHLSGLQSVLTRTIQKKTFNNLIDWPDDNRAKLPSLPKRAGVVTPTTPPLDAPLIGQEVFKGLCQNFPFSYYEIAYAHVRVILCMKRYD